MATQIDFPNYIKIPAKINAVSVSMPINIFKNAAWKEAHPGL